MREVVLVSTGGTIASRRRSDGGHTAADGADVLSAGTDLPAGVRLRTREVRRLNSFNLSPVDMADVLAAVREALADPDTSGVVVTHGTDTMEETAFLVDLFHDDARPVVFTGAQRAADDPRTDGPGNLRDAVALAAGGRADGLGVLLLFDGTVFAAAGTRKTETLASQAFSAPDAGPVGRVVDGGLLLRARPVRRPVLDASSLRLAGVRVDIVALYPGADGTALRAHVAAGARGLVLEGTGLGNANLAVLDDVRRAVHHGVAVVVSTRVHAGPVLGVYADGGGHDLLAAGALSAGTLRPSQARMLLLAELGTGADPAGIGRRLRAYQPSLTASDQPA